MSTTKKGKSKGKTAGKGKAKAAAKTKAGVGAKKTNGGTKPKRVSALDAAAQVLEKAGKPMSCGQLIEAMAEQGMWTSPGGKTPSATLYSAITREINKATDGGVSRFRKMDRGQFAFNKAGG